MDPLISVIVPVYNGQDYLENCINSIQEQTYQKKEIIIVDDGSRDRTGEICRELSDKYGNIQVIAMEDQGVSAARNAGLCKAVGDYVMFVDADDRLHPEMLQILYDVLVSTGSAVAGCGFFSWSNKKEWESGAKAVVTDEDKKPCILPNDGLLRQIAWGKDTRCWAKLYKRTIMKEHRFREDLTIGEDMLFLLDILQDVDQMVSVGFKGYGYYQNPAGAMNREFTPAYMDQITCWELAREAAVKTEHGSGMEAVVTEKLLMAIMLTAGKLSFLSSREKKVQEKYIRTCILKLRENLKVEGAYGRLSRGYQVKVKLFEKAPAFYLWLYHFRKYI